MDDEPRKPRERWSGPSSLTPREALVAAFVFLVTLIQVVVPAIVLASGPSEERGNDEYLYRYGWQMFTDSEQEVRYEAVHAGGTRQQVDPLLVLGSLWGNVHYGNATFHRLCRELPEATMISRHIRPRSGDEPSIERFRCS